MKSETPPFPPFLRRSARGSPVSLGIVVGIASWAAWCEFVDDRAGMAGRGEPKTSDHKAGIAGTASVTPAEPRYDLFHERASRLVQQLNQPVQTFVQPPFVLAGDLSETELQAKLEAVIQPVCDALLASYFRKPPDRPVLILMFTTEAAYRRAAEQLFFDRDVSQFGYYKPGRQTILVNLATGDGGLFHELTHVLMDVDFPNAPQWLQEGLATLHEASELRGAGRGAGADSLETRCAVGAPASGRRDQNLAPLLNWRGAVLRRARSEGRLPSVRQLITSARFRGAGEALDYAYARYFCLFLHQRGVLERFYALLRQHAATDPTGGRTLREILAVRNWDAVDDEFRIWFDDLDRGTPLEQLGAMRSDDPTP